jgi:hypothetical protein
MLSGELACYEALRAEQAADGIRTALLPARSVRQQQFILFTPYNRSFLRLFRNRRILHAAYPFLRQAQFEEYLRDKAISNSLQGVYRKWLRY